MSAAKPLLKEMSQYWAQLNEQRQKVLLGVVKTIVDEGNWWGNKEYIAEMDKRIEGMKTGKVKETTLDQLEEGARKAYKARKCKK